MQRKLEKANQKSLFKCIEESVPLVFVPPSKEAIERAKTEYAFLGKFRLVTSLEEKKCLIGYLQLQKEDIDIEIKRIIASIKQ